MITPQTPHQTPHQTTPPEAPLGRPKDLPQEPSQEPLKETLPKNKWYDWYKEFDQHHSPEARQQWYSAIAQAYRWARPTYPDELVDKVVAKADLKTGSSILEIGCGPGIATQAFAARGLKMQCVEPSPAACELARQVAGNFTGSVTVTNSTFEAFDLNDRTFDAVLAATSFHWVSPAVACRKSAAALSPGGSLILLWATPPQLNPDLCEALQPIYEKYQLADKIQYHSRQQAYYQANFDEFAQMIGDSEWFARTAVELETHQSQYSIEKYVALLSTLSDYIALPDDTRKSLLDDLAERLETLQGEKSLTLTHWFAAQVAPLISL
ncbi:MAG: class I SAM-dependent methyltransferase [Phormidesmis sp.]